ncbi:hypothetical protein O6H91_18G066200 [Diphasiastrum complanatum]|uniref:Uncharacterized protein n=1 Tax=Diphasiastrum complanatum TaxID=34168 RepID=A0ACC2B274_DIPCM|nr:hypothetical protein O6H91_Y106800 [Diphasiastrum complanatum]KAJ7523878.1 hypothetical protein O6H91_18G066200 [Diphasiastrum complanatum]
MAIFSNPEVNVRRFAASRRIKLGAFLLRFLAFVLCAAAVIAMVTSREHKRVPVAIPGLRSNVGFDRTADYGYSKAFTYIITAATISAAYALLQGARSLSSFYLGLETGGECFSWFTLLGDQVMTYLLLAAGAASTEVVYVGENGIRPTATWIALCVIFSKFCKHVVASIIFTFLATIVFSISTILSAYELFHRYG